MSSSSVNDSVQRPAFFEGQILTAADLNACVHSQRALRWLHNRGLHNWGIVFGCELTGSPDERVVRIAPGYALDCRGRELVLPETMELAIPPVAGPKRFALAAAYAEDEALDPVTRTGACGAMGAVRRPEQPILQWHDLSDSEKLPRPGLDIVLGSILVSNCRLAEPVSGAGRRSARPETQPYVAAGSTLAGRTEWTLWPEDRPVGVSTKVDTSGAGFRSTPSYQVQVVCERLAPALKNMAMIDAVRVRPFFAGYPCISEPTSTGFELRMVMPLGITMVSAEPVSLNQPPAGVESNDFVEMIKKDLGWHVSWLGIEG